jgi:hypothetical protein
LDLHKMSELKEAGLAELKKALPDCEVSGDF